MMSAKLLVGIITTVKSQEGTTHKLQDGFVVTMIGKNAVMLGSVEDYYKLQFLQNLVQTHKDIVVKLNTLVELLAEDENEKLTELEKKEVCFLQKISSCFCNRSFFFHVVC